MKYGELLLEYGFECNNNCVFCYAEQHRWRKPLSLEESKSIIKSARERCESLVIVGGEPTIRKDILKIVAYARDCGFRSIFFESNGRMFAYEEFTKKIFEAGLTQPVVSIHSHIPEIHDWHTRAQGSWNQTIEGVKNLKKYFREVHSNTVITKKNYMDMEKIAEFLVDLEIRKSDFLFICPEGLAWKNFDEIAPSLTQIKTHIIPTINIGIKSNSCLVKMRYVPLCYLVGYEKYLSELVDKSSLNKERIGPGYEQRDITTRRENEAMKKGVQCSDCKYDPVCGGVWRRYAEKYGTSELKPVSGKKIFSAKELLE